VPRGARTVAHFSQERWLADIEDASLAVTTEGRT
jgi:hypothetical protein